MPPPNEGSRLLENSPVAENGAIVPSASKPEPRSTSYSAPPASYLAWPKPENRPVNINIMKRNMSVAKGFIDISLLTANASQLKHLLILGDSSDKLYYVIFTGLVLSLILQIVTGVLLIVKERFDLDVLEDQAQAELYNNITLGFVFATLGINVFVSSLGVSVLQRHSHPDKQYSEDGYQDNWNFLSSRNAPTNQSLNANLPAPFSG